MIRPLRIVLICQQGQHRPELPAYGFWAHYFLESLREAGHTVLEVPDCDWGQGLLPLARPAREAWLAGTWHRASAYIEREHARSPIDFLLTYLFPAQVSATALAALRRRGVRCVNFFCDNVREFRRIPEEFFGFDLHWVPEFQATSLYLEAGQPFLHAPMPCWVPPVLRTAPVQESCPVTFIGTRDPQREELFAEAIIHGLRPELRGTGWETDALPPASLPPGYGLREKFRHQGAFVHQHGWRALLRKYRSRWRATRLDRHRLAEYARSSPTPGEYWRVVREATVLVGVNRFPSFRFPARQPATYSRLRDIEAPMAGACYLTEWTDGLDQLYALGTEIETYRDARELAAKAAELTADPARRRHMRVAAQKRALEHHSIGRTISRIRDRLLGAEGGSR